MGCHEQQVTSGKLANIQRECTNFRVIERHSGYVRKDVKCVTRQAPNREFSVYIDVGNSHPFTQF
jgi:hypothetical protein